LAEATSRVGYDLGDLVRREPDQHRVPVTVEVEATEVRLDDVVEHSLVVAHDDELACCPCGRRVVTVLGVVIQDFGAIGVQPPCGKRVSQPQF
jgi:hypothetical protein